MYAAAGCQLGVRPCLSFTLSPLSYIRKKIMVKNMTKKQNGKRAVAVMLLLAVSVMAVSVSHAESVDEYQGLHDAAYGIATASTMGGAQSFQVDDPYVYQVEFYVDTASSPDLQVYIDDDQDINNGFVYNSGSIDVSGWSAGWHTWNLRSHGGEVELSTDTTYYLIVAEAFPWKAGAEWHGHSGWDGPGGDPYSDGQAYYIGSDGTYSAVLGVVDFAFYIYTDVDPVCRWSYYTDDLTVYVDASDSYTPDGESISTYKWDWTGDGSWDDSESTATASYTYGVAGDYTVKC
jgi:hypothetical protein